MVGCLVPAVRRGSSVLLVHGAGGGAWVCLCSQQPMALPGVASYRRRSMPNAVGGSQEWRLWAPVLAAAGLDAKALDLQPVAGGLVATRFEDYLEQVVAAGKEQPGGGPDLLVGASMGGAPALAAAAALRPQALVLVCRWPLLELPITSAPSVCLTGCPASTAWCQ